MTESELDQAIDQIRKVTMEAVRLDRKILKKTWGLYYIVWAIAIALFDTVYIPIAGIRNQTIQIILYLVIYGAIFFMAMYVTTSLFKRARALGKLSRGFVEESIRNRIATIFINVLLFIMILFLASGILRYPIGLIGLFIIFLLIYTGIFRGMKKDMGEIPFEGYLSSGSFFFSAAASTLSSFIGYGYTLYGFIWLIASGCWFISGYISLRDYTKMMEETSEHLRVD